jgi:hypothetical protein
LRMFSAQRAFFSELICILFFAIVLIQKVAQRQDARIAMSNPVASEP